MGGGQSWNQYPVEIKGWLYFIFTITQVSTVNLSFLNNPLNKQNELENGSSGLCALAFPKHTSIATMKTVAVKPVALPARN